MRAAWTRSKKPGQTLRSKPIVGPWHLLSYPGKTKCGIDCDAEWWEVKDLDVETVGDVKDQTGGKVCYRCTGATTRSDKIGYDYDNSTVRPHISRRQSP